MTTDDAAQALFRSAALCHGVTTTAEALRLGVTRAQLRTGLRRGVWRSPHPGILVATAAPSTWLQDCAIGVAGARGVASHRAAARLHRLDGFADAPVEVTVARRRPSVGLPGIVHRTDLLDRRDRTVVAGIASTSLARTLVDLGAVIGDDEVEQALDDALRRGTSLRWIVETLERVDRPGPTGSASLRRVLARPDRHGPIPDSIFERMVERVSVEAGLPAPQRQIRVDDAHGRQIARIDAGWPEIGFGMEAHSARWHFGARAGRRDTVRDRRLSAAGWDLIYVTWWDLEHPQEFLDDLVRGYRLREHRAAT